MKVLVLMLNSCFPLVAFKKSTPVMYWEKTTKNSALHGSLMVSWTRSTESFLTVWAASWWNLFMAYANNKDADQPAYLPSLISLHCGYCGSYLRTPTFRQTSKTDQTGCSESLLGVDVIAAAHILNVCTHIQSSAAPLFILPIFEQ